MFLVIASAAAIPWSTFPADWTKLFSLPFPITEAPVGIKSAEIGLLWTDYYNEIFDVYIFSADYIISFSGDEAAIIKIAHPVPVGFPHTGLPIDFHTYVDGVPIEAVGHLIHENFPNITLSGLWKNVTPFYEDFINDAHSHMAGESFFATTFESDTPMALHSFTVDVPDGVGVENITLLFYYDYERTRVISSWRGNIGGQFDHELGTVTMRKSINFPLGLDSLGRGGTRNIHLFLLGEDTLTWEYELSFFEGATKDDSLEVFKLENTSYVTPRNYFRQIQEDRFVNRHSGLVIDPDLLMRHVDERHQPWNFSDFNTVGTFRVVTDNPSFVVVEIPFEPGQERVLSISFSGHVRRAWNAGVPFYLFHNTIITEAAEYWDFFDSLTVTLSHPEDIVNYALSDGFETFENFSVITLQNPRDTIYFAYLLPEESRNLVVIATLLVTLLIIVVLYKKIKPRGSTPHPAGD